MGSTILNHDLRPTEHPIAWAVINSLVRIFHFKSVLQIEI